MKEFDKFKQSYDAAIKEIKKFTAPSHGMSAIANWMLTTDANPYTYLPEHWSESSETAEGFASLLRFMSHAIYDDGDITFVTVNGQPRILFDWRHEEDIRVRAMHSIEKDCEENYGSKYDVKILDIAHEDFGSLYDEWQRNDIKRCFMADAVMGVDWAVNVYRKYNCWDESWIDEAKVEYEK